MPPLPARPSTISPTAVQRLSMVAELSTVTPASRARSSVRHHLIAEQARIHFLRGNLCFPRGDLDGCLREHGIALELAKRADATELEAMALGGLGDAEYVRGRMISAHNRFSECVELCERHGLGRIEVANRPMTAFTQWFAGNTRGAVAVADTAIARAVLVGHRRAEMIGHHAG